MHYRSLQAKENIKVKSINLMEKKFNVDRRVISNWIKQGDKHVNTTHKRDSYNLKSKNFKSVCEVIDESSIYRDIPSS